MTSAMSYCRLLWSRAARLSNCSILAPSYHSKSRPPVLPDEIAEEIFEGPKFARGIPSQTDMEAITKQEADRMEYGRRRAIVEKKFGFQPPSEDNMLTWEAKDLIFQLYKESQLEWTPERIAQSFPVSEEGARRLLKAARKEYRPRVNAEKIKAHDDLVKKRWKALESGRPCSELSDFTRQLFYEGKIKYIPHISYSQFATIVETDEKPKRPAGVFTKMIQAHLERNCQNKVERKK